MTWQFDVNNTYAGGADSVGGWCYRLKALLVSVGWAVRGSGDGLSAYEDIDQATGGAGTGDGGAYDVITQESSWGGGAAGDMGNENAWYRIREPGSTREFLFQRNDAFLSFGQGEDDMEVVFSPTGFVTGGSATVRPTATDEQVIVNGQMGQSNTYSSNARVHVAAEDTAVGGVYAWYFVNIEQGGSNMLQCMMYEPVDQPQTGDTQPFVIIEAEDLTYNGFLDNGGVRFYRPPGTTTFGGGDAVAFRTESGSQVIPRGIPVQADSIDRAFPILAWSADQTYKGFLHNARWKGGATRDYPDTRDLATADARVYMNDFLLPWEQNTVPDT